MVQIIKLKVREQYFPTVHNNCFGDEGDHFIECVQGRLVGELTAKMHAMCIQISGTSIISLEFACLWCQFCITGMK